MAMTDALLPEFDNEMATTRRVLERVPLADGDWKPHEKSFSLGALAGHVSNIPTWGPLILSADAFDMAGGAAGGPSRQTHTTTASLLAEFDANVAAARGALASADDAALMQTWSLKNGEQVFFTLPKAVVLRNFVFNHIVHHRGQLSVYLRLRNIPVPSIYGPSADEG
jgi:uncharacterized damage-inducible protein DinB